MQDLGARLAQRHEQLGLNGADTARRAGMKYQTFKKLLARLCEALALIPAQALGLAPVAGLDDKAAVPRRDLLLARIGAALRRAGPEEFAAAQRMLATLHAPERPAR